MLRTRAERTVAAALQGSCQVPLAVYSELDAEAMSISGLVGMPDGSILLRAERTGPGSEADRLASEVAGDLMDQGADRIIASLS